MKLLYLSHADVESINLPMRTIIDALDEAFLHKGEGSVEMPPKPGIHPRKDAFIHAMPAWIRSSSYAGMKWVSGYPQNQARGLPYIAGLLILNDADTGIPLSVMDCTWITAMRTGAATAVAARYLARPDSKTAGILGCGVQGRSNLLALREVFDLERVYAYDTDAKRCETFCREVTAATGLAVVAAKRPEHAVKELDLVVTAGPIMLRPHETIQADWLAPGAFASPVDFDSYWSRDAIRQVDMYFTDDVAQYAYYQKVGYFQGCPSIGGDLGELATGRKPGRENANQRTMCINLGLALDDIAVAPLIFEAAKQRGIGTELPL